VGNPAVESDLQNVLKSKKQVDYSLIDDFSFNELFDIKMEEEDI
jgi:hypothetical protein